MQIVKYFFVGGAATAVDFGIFAFFAGYLGYPWFVVSICSRNFDQLFSVDSLCIQKRI